MDQIVITDTRKLAASTAIAFAAFTSSIRPPAALGPATDAIDEVPWSLELASTRLGLPQETADRTGRRRRRRRGGRHRRGPPRTGGQMGKTPKAAATGTDANVIALPMSDQIITLRLRSRSTQAPAGKP